MRKTKLYILFTFVLVCATSCLDKIPEDFVLSEKAISTVDEADQAVIGIYSSFLNNALYSGNLTLLPDIQSDLLYAVNGYSNIYGNIWRWNILATSPEVEAVYGSLYQVITRCNFLLDNVEEVRKKIYNDDDYDRLDQYCGEAYFARALAYSELIKLFCKAYDPDKAADELGVVLVSHYDGDEPITRSSLFDSYKFVLSDLDKAEHFLKLEEDFKGVLWGSAAFNEYTVYALRARIALYMQDWESAKKYSSKVIDSGYYRLANAKRKVNDKMNEYQYMWAYDESHEIIWKIGFTINNYGGSLGRIFFNYDYKNFKPDYVPASWVLNSYDAQDLRYSAFFVEFTTGYAHGLTWPLLAKYFGNEEFASKRILHTTMPKVFRLSEQYLIRAEALAQQRNYSQASKDLSELHKARYASDSQVSVNDDNWRDVIESERVKELFMEGFRLQDLKRWHKGFKRKPQLQTLSNGSSLSIDADDPLFVWPIPQNEIGLPGTDIKPNESNK